MSTNHYKALQALQELKDLDWEEHGKPSLLALATAAHFILMLPRDKCYPNTISPNRDWGVTVKWSLHPYHTDKKLILTFEQDSIHLAYKPVVGEPIYEDGIVYCPVNDHLIQKIVSYIPEIQT